MLKFEIFFENAITILPITYLKCVVKIENAWFTYKKRPVISTIYTSYLSINF